MATSFSTDEAEWQGVDDEPTNGSDNLVKSGGVFSLISEEKATIIGTDRIADESIIQSKLNRNFIQSLPIITDTDKSDLDISDEEGNVVIRCKEGHIITQNFNSKTVSTIMDTDKSDLDISDEEGNVVIRCKEGHVITQKFNSEEISKNRMSKLRILCIGDSITEGDYGSEPAGTGHVKAENYPYFLQEYLQCANVVNKGKCGYTATAWWDNVANNIDYTEFDVAVIMLGLNKAIDDNLSEDVEPFENYNDYKNEDGAMCKIIEYALSVNEQLNILLCTPTFVNQDKRYNNFLNSLNSNNSVKNIGKRYGLPVKDLLYEGGISKYNTNRMQPVDGLHFGLIGYQRLATQIGNFILSQSSFVIK